MLHILDIPGLNVIRFYDQDFKKIRGKFLFVLSFERGAFTMDQLSQRASKQQVGEVNT